MHGRFNRTALGLCASLVLILSGCGGGSDNEPAATKSIISGTVATGAPLSGAITAIGANGALANTISGAGGAYALAVNGLTFPILVRADDGAGTVLYSWADAEGDTANVTPLTTLALVSSDLSDNLSDVFANWPAIGTQLNNAMMQAAQAVVNTNLQSQFTGEGVDYTNYDFLTTPFSADGTGIDGVLDGLQFNFDYLGSDLNSVITITLADGATPVAFDVNIDTGGITFDGGGTGGA